MLSSPTTFVAKLLAAMQVLMTLDMPLSTTMALPVTSKPIESTVENLAWQAWIELPPEQKQQVKSRKVTPKSIFTLPLRVECPEGHKQVDRKCIPIAIGSNAVLIDLNALGLLVGSTQTEDMYDYDDFGEELSSPLAFGSEVPAGEAVKSSDGLAVDLKPPAKDEPLKFNIFQNKFHIFHEEPIEDYSALSNEGVQSSEKEQTANATTPSSTSNNTAASATFLTDLVSEASNIAEDVNRFFEQLGKTASASDNVSMQSQTALNLDDDIDFQIEAISIPAFGNHSSVQLVTTIMDAETTTTNKERDKLQDNDLTTLLQTESFLPLLNHTTATTLQDSETYPLTKLPLPEPSDTASDLLSLGVDEEITTLTTPMERYVVDAKHKQEYTRSVTLNPLFSQDIDGSAVDASGEDDQPKTSTLETVTNDDTLETTTPIQLDDTTIIESHSSLSAAAATQQELKELLLQQEQAMKEFEELQRLRKGQKDQHVVLKKSKVQPVEVLSTTTEATMATTTTTITATAAATAASLPTATKSLEELSTTTAETETATPTPLLTFHNENENNDWFYYQHSAKQDNDVKLRSAAQLEPTTATENVADASPLAALSITGQPTAAPAQNPDTATTTTTTETMQSSETAAETIPLASEIDLAEELLAINELVKGIRQPTTLTTITKMPTVTVTATTITTTTTATTLASEISSNNIESSLSTSSPSESTSLSSPLSSSSSPAEVKKAPLTTSQIWSKILPLLTTSTTTPMPKNSPNESFSETTTKESNVSQTFDSQIHSASFSSERSNRNSKIIRIKGFKKISAAAKLKIKDFTTEAVIIPPTTTTTTSGAEEFTPYLLSTTTTTTTATSETSIPATSSSSAENFTYEPYWWLPASWRLDKPTSTEKQSSQQDATAQSEKQHPLLLRFWSAYRSKSS